MSQLETKNQSLSEAISDILSTAPSFYEEDPQESKAIITKGSLQDDDDADELQLTQIQKHNIVFLEDIDKEYSGVKGNRRDLKNRNEDWSTDQEIGIEDRNSESNNSDDYTTDDENSVEDSSDDSNENSEDNSEQANISYIPESHNLPIITNNADSQTKKGMSVRNQLNIWENLLEMRIQLQKCLILANKMPMDSTFKDIKEQSPIKFASKVNDTEKSVRSVLNKLLDLQLLLLNQYPETERLSTKRKNSNSKDFEEISISSEKETESEEEAPDNIPSKRQKISDYEVEISRYHSMYSPYRNSVVKKWDDRTRITTVKTSNSQYSVLNQIDHILKNKQKLIKKTHVQQTSQEIHDKVSDENLSELNQDNVEVFDDSDFYHKLLRELIDVKSTDVTDPTTLKNRWIQLHNIRSKMKRNIDTRATKGRKVRYTVHSKLVNFMAPINNNTCTEEARLELCNSLFAKN